MEWMPSSSLREEGGQGSGPCPLRLSFWGRLFISVSFLQMLSWQKLFISLTGHIGFTNGFDSEHICSNCPPLVRHVPVSLYCYSQQYYGLGFFLLFIYFPLDLESRARSVVQLVKCLPVNAPAIHKGNPKHGGMCRKVRSSRSLWAARWCQPDLCLTVFEPVSHKQPNKGALKSESWEPLCPCWHHKVTVTVMGNSMHGLFCK